MIDMDVTWLQAGAGVPAGPLAFSVLAPGGDEPLVDQALGAEVAKALTAKGSVEDGAAPAWLLKVTHSVTVGEETLPDKHRKETYWQNGQTKEVTRYRRGVPTTELVNTDGRWKEKTVAEPGGTRPIYIVKVAMQVYPAPWAEGALPRWEGSVMAKQEVSDPLKHAPALVRELMREFPVGSGAPSHRKVAAR